jgi:hypothetical protein
MIQVISIKVRNVELRGDYLVLTDNKTDTGMVQIRMTDIHAVTWLDDEPMSIYVKDLVVKIIDDDLEMTSVIVDCLAER